MPETAIQKIEVRTITPVLDTINAVLVRKLKANVEELAAVTNRAIEKGVKTDENAAIADTAVRRNYKAINIGHEIRKQYTRPLDDGKKEITLEVEIILSPIVESNKILDDLVMERSREIKAAEAEAKREAEQEQRDIEEAARKEEKRRKNISLAQGGEGNYRPVKVDAPIRPVAQIGMMNATRTRSIPDRDIIEKAVENGIREIPGVHIFQVWTFKVEDSKKVPELYRKDVRG